MQRARPIGRTKPHNATAHAGLMLYAGRQLPGPGRGPERLTKLVRVYALKAGRVT